MLEPEVIHPNIVNCRPLVTGNLTVPVFSFINTELHAAGFGLLAGGYSVGYKHFTHRFQSPGTKSTVQEDVVPLTIFGHSPHASQVTYLFEAAKEGVLVMDKSSRDKRIDITIFFIEIVYIKSYNESMKRFALLCIIFLTFFIVVSPLRADQLDDISKQLDDLKKTFNELSSANQTNENQLQNLQKQLDGIKSKVFILEGQIETKQAQVVEGEKAFTTQQKLLNQRAKSYYKNMGKNSFSMVNLLLSDNISQSLQNYFYQKTLVDEDRKAIIRIAIFIKQVEDKKKQLETERQQLAAVKADVDKQSTFLAGEVAKSKKYLGELQSKIASLTAQQQSIIAQKLSGLHIPTSANTSGRCDSDLTNGRDPGFSPKFAFFTYGVPNRVGMNQYGAKGRADKGDGYESILRAYYNFDSFKDFEANINVNDGNGINQGNIIWSGNLEDYVKRVYEVSSSWHNEALKAQVIAARSYVLAATSNGRDSICANEFCQAFQVNEKNDSGGRWLQAVTDTSKKAMVKGDSPIKAWFSSTHGGYIYSSAEIGWSDTGWTRHGSDFEGSVNSFDDLNNKAFDGPSHGNSPWFYCDWGSRGDSKTAWIRPQELADIINVILLVRKNSSNACFVYQPDQSPPAPDPNKGCPQTGNWSPEKVRQELGSGAFTTVDSVSVSADFGYGQSTNVSGNGDAGNFNISATEFKNFFNVRAPANIQIVGPLFNVEKR